MEEYLGDGLYALDEGFQIRLRADENVVYLDKDVLRAFMSFIEKARGLKVKIEKAKTG